jgi:hypothetical protein
MRSAGAVRVATVFGLLFGSSPITAQVQVQRIQLNPQGTPPSRLLVKRGTVVEFYGDLPDGDAVLPTTLTVRCGALVRASGTFKKTWSLRWDPSKESTATSYAMVYRADSGQQESRVARIGVTVVDSAPFQLTAPRDRQDVTGVVPVQVSATGGLRIAGGEILVDGAGRAARIDAQGRGKVNILGLPPGVHSIFVRVSLEGGGDFETEPVKVSLAADVKLVRDQVGPVDLRRSTAPLVLSVSLGSGLQAKSADFFLDGKSFAHSDSPPFSDVSLNPKGLGTGAHTLNVEVTTTDGEKHRSASVPLDVIGNAQADFATWYEKLQRLMESGEPVRAAFNAALDQWSADRTTVGELNESAKKLRAVDLSFEYNVTKLDLPVSLNEADKTELSSALGEMRAAYGRLVREEEAILRAIATNVDHRTNLANMNTAILKIASANERIQQVAEHLGNAEQGRQQSASLLAYPANGDIRNDFPAMVLKLNDLMEQAESVRTQYDDGTASSANILALNKAISQDTWTSNNITKLALPRALPLEQRTEMTNILQGISSAYRYRSDAERILKHRLASDLGIAGPVTGLSGNVRIDESSQMGLFNKAQLTLGQARERLKALSRRMGFGD